MEDDDTDLLVVPHPLTPGLASGQLHVKILPYSPTDSEERAYSCPLLSVEPRHIPFDDVSPRIRPGTYVAFGLSTDLISEQFPEGSETREAIRGFPRKIYVGLVSESYVSFIDDGFVRANELTVHFVTRAVPSRSAPSKFYLPMYPTGDDRVSKAELRTSTLFPYVDCNQWTIKEIKLMAHQVHDSPLDFALEDNDFCRFEIKGVVDSIYVCC